MKKFILISFLILTIISCTAQDYIDWVVPSIECNPVVNTLNTPITIGANTLTLYGNAVTPCNTITGLEIMISYNSNMSGYSSVSSGSTTQGQYYITTTDRVGYSSIYITPSTTYYYQARMVITPSIGGSSSFYGSIMSVTTLPETSVTVSDIAQTHASMSFIIRSQHGVLTNDGVAISTSTNPVITDPLSVFMSESCGCYDVSVGIYRGGLSANTTYYYRAAYSTSTGTYYGTQGNFTTLP